MEQNPEINIYVYSQLIFDKSVKEIHLSIVLWINDAGTIGYLYIKNEVGAISHTVHKN